MSFPLLQLKNISKCYGQNLVSSVISTNNSSCFASSSVSGASAFATKDAAFQSEPVLVDVSLSLNSGQSIAIMGPSGSGKTTLLHIAGLLSKPSSGSVIISGEDCTAFSDEKLAMLRKSKIGFVYQFHHLLPEFNVFENLMIAARIGGLSKKQAYFKSIKMLQSFGLSDRANMMVNQLSGGEQQRVAIGRSVINNQSIVFADEPTGNLDASNADLVMEILLQRTTAQNKALVIVTHDKKIAETTDRILYLKNGILVSANEI